MAISAGVVIVLAALLLVGRARRGTLRSDREGRRICGADYEASHHQALRNIIEDS